MKQGVQDSLPVLLLAAQCSVDDTHWPLWLPCGKDDATVHQHGSHDTLFPGPSGHADSSVLFILNSVFS